MSGQSNSPYLYTNYNPQPYYNPQQSQQPQQYAQPPQQFLQHPQQPQQPQQPQPYTQPPQAYAQPLQPFAPPLYVPPPQPYAPPPQPYAPPPQSYAPLPQPYAPPPQPYVPPYSQPPQQYAPPYSQPPQQYAPQPSQLALPYAPHVDPVDDLVSSVMNISLSSQRSSYREHQDATDAHVEKVLKAAEGWLRAVNHNHQLAERTQDFFKSVFTDVAIELLYYRGTDVGVRTESILHRFNTMASKIPGLKAMVIPEHPSKASQHPSHQPEVQQPQAQPPQSQQPQAQQPQVQQPQVQQSTVEQPPVQETQAQRQETPVRVDPQYASTQTKYSSSDTTTRTASGTLPDLTISSHRPSASKSQTQSPIQSQHHPLEILSWYDEPVHPNRTLHNLVSNGLVKSPFNEELKQHNDMILNNNKYGVTVKESLSLCIGTYEWRHGCPYKQDHGICLANHNLTQEQLNELVLKGRITPQKAIMWVRNFNRNRPVDAIYDIETQPEWYDGSLDDRVRDRRYRISLKLY